MASQLKNLPIHVLIEGVTERAFLSYDRNGPIIKLQAGASTEISDTFVVVNDVLVNSQNESVVHLREHPHIVFSNPILKVEKGYVLDGNRPEPLYPPSKAGWLSRVKKSGRNVALFIHRIKGDSRFWLVVVDQVNSVIHEAHSIFPFEVGILEIEDEFEGYTSAFKSRVNEDKSKNWMKNILLGPSPPWGDLMEIVKGVHIPGLRIGRTTRETMEQLVPDAYDPPIREQIMAFLALITKWDIPEEDSVDYFTRIYPLDVLSTLLLGYLSCIFSGNEVPPYVKIFYESSQHLLTIPSRPLRASIGNPWGIAHYKITSQIPKIFKNALDYSSELNKTRKIILGLPVTKKQAIHSQDAWANRCLLLASGFRLSTYVRPKALGLARLVDITRAHQWPHKHMRWSASIAGSTYKEPHIQVMEMPLLAADRVIRTRPNVVTLEWSASTVNTNLYDSGKEKWRIPFKRITNALGGNRTPRKLGNEFGAWKGTKIHSPKLKWAKCLDLTANLGYLASLEQPEYLKQFGLTPENLLQVITELKEKEIIDFTYAPVFPFLMTIAIVGQGPSERICSLSRAFLKHTPSATVSLAEDGQWTLILTRVPSPIARKLLTSLPEETSQEGVTLTCHRVTTFRSYTWGFYQRILREDGTWDDDVSAMLSQIRLPYPDDNS